MVSGDTGQFQLDRDGLSWGHAERLVQRLDTFIDQHRAVPQRARSVT